MVRRERVCQEMYLQRCETVRAGAWGTSAAVSVALCCASVTTRERVASLMWRLGSARAANMALCVSAWPQFEYANLQARRQLIPACSAHEVTVLHVSTDATSLASEPHTDTCEGGGGMRRSQHTGRGLGKLTPSRSGGATARQARGVARTCEAPPGMCFLGQRHAQPVRRTGFPHPLQVLGKSWEIAGAHPSSKSRNH